MLCRIVTGRIRPTISRFTVKISDADKSQEVISLLFKNPKTAFLITCLQISIPLSGLLSGGVFQG